MMDILKEAKRKLKNDIEKNLISNFQICNIKEILKYFNSNKNNNRIITPSYDVAKWFYNNGFNGYCVYSDPKTYNNYNICNGYLIQY